MAGAGVTSLMVEPSPKVSSKTVDTSARAAQAKDKAAKIVRMKPEDEEGCMENTVRRSRRGGGSAVPNTRPVVKQASRRPFGVGATRPWRWTAGYFSGGGEGFERGVGTVANGADDEPGAMMSAPFCRRWGMSALPFGRSGCRPAARFRNRPRRPPAIGG